MQIITSVLPPVLIIIGLIVIFQTFLKRSTRKYERNKNNFIEQEQQASFSRAREIEEERYIKPNIENFPIMLSEDTKTEEELYAYKLQQAVLLKLDKPMGHFEENNIELKKLYGAVNLEVIIQSEENYTEFLHKLNAWAKALVDADKKYNAIKVLEEGIKLGMDFTQSFILLADLYKETDNKEDLKKLYDLTKQNKNITMGKVVSHIESLL